MTDYAELIRELRIITDGDTLSCLEEDVCLRTAAALDQLSAENARLREALSKIMETGTTQHHEQIGDAYSEDGWAEWETVSAEAEIARAALQQGDKKLLFSQMKKENERNMHPAEQAAKAIDFQLAQNAAYLSNRRISRPTDIVELLRLEADASEELYPGDSEIQVMRDAADEIERMRIRHADLMATIGRFTSNG